MVKIPKVFVHEKKLINWRTESYAVRVYRKDGCLKIKTHVLEFLKNIFHLFIIEITESGFHMEILARSMLVEFVISRKPLLAKYQTTNHTTRKLLTLKNSYLGCRQVNVLIDKDTGIFNYEL